MSRKRLKKTSEIYKNGHQNNGVQNNKIFIRPRLEPKNQSQADCLELIKNKDIIFIDGPAGSGKTFLSVVYGLLQVIKGHYEKLILIRPAVTTEEIGLLPGTIEEKVTPFLEPMLEIIFKYITKEEFEQLRRDNKIQVKSMAYLRGLTFDNSFIVVDEAQNLSDKAMKLIVTRIGMNSKLIIQGDIEQSDLKAHEKGSLARHVYLFKNFRDEFGSFEFSDKDIVRSPLITMYLDRIKDYNETYKSDNKQRYEI